MSDLSVLEGIIELDKFKNRLLINEFLIDDQSDLLKIRDIGKKVEQVIIDICFYLEKTVDRSEIYNYDVCLENSVNELLSNIVIVESMDFPEFAKSRCFLENYKSLIHNLKYKEKEHLNNLMDAISIFISQRFC